MPADIIESRRTERSGLVTTAILLAVIGALAALGYAGFALTLRRGVYADLEDDPASVTEDDAKNSDNINAIGLWAAGLLVGIAFVLLIVAMISARRGRNVLGITGALLVVLGALAATWGCLLVNGVDDVSEAGDAVTGYLVAGPAFAAMAVGLLLGALGLRRPARTAPSQQAAPQTPFPPDPYSGQQPPYAGQQPPYAGQQSPYGDQQSPYGDQQSPYGGQPDSSYGYGGSTTERPPPGGQPYGRP